jgi:Arm DNA-binding domain
MPLTDAALRAAKPGAKINKLSDGAGLQLWVTPDGAKRWRLAYRFNGKQKTLAIGVYPTTSLRKAREAREAAKILLKAKLDPSHHRKTEKAANVKASADTFAAIAEELLDKKRREAKSERTMRKLNWLFRLCLPTLGFRPIGEISAAEILSVLRTVEMRGHLETARRLRATIAKFSVTRFKPDVRLPIRPERSKERWQRRL